MKHSLCTVLQHSDWGHHFYKKKKLKKKVKNNQKAFNYFTLNKIISQLYSSQQMVSATCLFLQSSLLDRKLDFKRHVQGSSTPIFLFQMCIMMTVKPTFVDSLVWVYVLIFDSSCFFVSFLNLESIFSLWGLFPSWVFIRRDLGSSLQTPWDYCQGKTILLLSLQKSNSDYFVCLFVVGWLVHQVLQCCMPIIVIRISFWVEDFLAQLSSVNCTATKIITQETNAVRKQNK